MASDHIAHVFFAFDFDPRSSRYIKYLSRKFAVIRISKRYPSENYFQFFIRSLFTLLKKKPALVHAHRIRGFLPAVVYKILHWQSVLIYDKHDIHKLDFLIDHLAIFADAIIVASDPHKKRMEIKLKGIVPVYVIYNFSDFEEPDPRDVAELKKKLGIPEDKVVLLYQGSIVPEYGLDILVDALSNLEESVRDKIFLLIVGFIKYPMYFANCLLKLKAIGFKNYKIIENVPREEMPKYISLADLSLILFKNTPLTRYDNPNKLFESLRLGVPVIISNLPSLSPFIGNRVGFIVNNKEELCMLIRELIINPSELSLFKRKINRQAFHWQIEFRKYLNILRNIILRKLK